MVEFFKIFTIFTFVIMKFSKDDWIIIGFAMLHAAVAWGCRMLGLADEVMLTLLTMLLVVFLCLRHHVSVAFMAISIIAVNLVGLVLGYGSSTLLALVFSSPLVIYPLSTFFTTLIIGYSILWASKRYQKNHRVRRPSSGDSLKWLIITFAVVIALRLVLAMHTGEGVSGQNAVITILVNYIFTLVAVVVLTEYALRLQERAREASEEANLAKYRYVTLKRQLDPHFLFNSLNVLDCMIQDQSKEDASLYTHKLAEVYRYLIQSSEEETVSLRDEMTFVRKYVDLLMVRFPEGLEVTMQIPEEDMSSRVVPCGVQLLIENATKHNAVRGAAPLHISIASSEGMLIVTNNICPRVSTRSSEGTGLGLQYIRQQYEKLSDIHVEVIRDSSSFTVKLPLL